MATEFVLCECELKFCVMYSLHECFSLRSFDVS